MSGLKLSTNASVVIIVVMALACAGFLIWSDSPMASAFIPLLLPFAGGAIVSVLKQRDTDNKVEEIKVEATAATAQATAATAQSQQNGAQLATIDAKVGTLDTKVDENTAVTDTVHGAVNGQMAAFRQNLERTAQLEIQVAEMQAKLDTALARAEGMETGRAQVVAEQAGHPAEPQADGSILVEAPATIKVVTP